jgi:hypothetical protein
MRISRGGTGDPPPTPEQLALWHRRISPPENELPAGVGLSVLLGRTEDTAVGITGVEAFSTGFRFRLAVRLRRPRPDLIPGGLHLHVSAHRQATAGIPMENRLLLGIEYLDGRRASNLYVMPPPPTAVTDGERLVLTQESGGGGDQSVDQYYWVAPLPPEGPVAVVLAWPGFGIPESRTALDGAAIRAAAARSRLLWPPQPPPEHRAPPPPPPRPSSGWFAEPPD